MKTIFTSVITMLKNDHASVMKNFFSLTFLKGLEYLVPLFLVPYLVRTLGLERYGIVQSAVSFMYIFYILTNFGFNYSAARQISIYRDNPEMSSKIAGAILILKSLLMMLSFIIMLGLAMSIPSLQSELGLIILTFGFIVGDVLFPVWLYQGYEKMFYLSRFQIIARIVLFVCTIVLIKTPEDYLYYPMIYYGSQILMAISTLMFANRLLGVSIAVPTKDIIVREYRLALKPFFSSIAQVLYTQPRLFYVSLIASPMMTGAFAIADKAAGVFQLFPAWLFVISALPRLSYMYEHEQEKCMKTLAMYQKWTCIYAFIMTPIALISAPWIIYAFSGQFHEEATFIFRILCVETLILTANIFLIHYFPISGNYEVFAKIYGLTCIVTLTLFGLLMPIYGIYGLLGGIITSSIILLLLTVYFRTKEKLVIS
ncbi:MAG: oligosaccharide flippase family protein [Ignavibacteria bacterium]